MAGLTVPQTKLSGPGGYTTTTPTLKGGAGALKPMVGSRGTPVRRHAVSPFSGGRRGSSGSTALKNTPRTIIPSVPDEE